MHQVSHQLASLASTWEQEVERRRKMSAHDAMADAIEYCASELRSELRRATDGDVELTPDEYAALHGKSSSTVRRWCKSGRLVSRAVGREYRIRKGEPCPDLRTSVAA